jgi:hypothetical protein
MFFTPEGLEQATGDAVATYRASRFPAGIAILVACCGFGGFARRLAARGPTVAIDRDHVSAVCTRLNFEVAPGRPQRETEFAAACADVTNMPLKRLAERGIAAAFFDPSRRMDDRFGGRRRISGAYDYSPPLSWADELRSNFSSVAVKVSPAIDDASLADFQDARIEFISSGGECKEAVLWFGPPADDLRLPEKVAEPYFATVLRPGVPPQTLTPFPCPGMETAPMGEYLYEPDPSVIRSHLIPQLAAQLSAAWIEPGIPYITSDRFIPTPFASAFQILDDLPYDRKEVQRRLRALGARIYSVKKRGVPLDPIEVQKGLEPCGDLPIDLILMRRSGRVLAILCQRMELKAQ